ncbi:MAG: hypothetical protein WKG01_24855 [Kofleriaceae bacterium]
MKLSDSVDRIREKALRRAQDADRQLKEQLEEARARLQAGKQVLHAELDKAGAARLADDMRRTGNVGKMTQTMVELAPKLLGDLDRASAELVDGKALARVAPKVDSMLQQIGVEEPLLGDLIGGLGAANGISERDRTREREARTRALLEDMPIVERTIVPRISATKARTIATQLAAKLRTDRKQERVDAAETKQDGATSLGQVAGQVVEQITGQVTDTIVAPIAAQVTEVIDATQTEVENVTGSMLGNTPLRRAVGDLRSQVQQLRAELLPSRESLRVSAPSNTADGSDQLAGGAARTTNGPSKTDDNDSSRREPLPGPSRTPLASPQIRLPAIPTRIEVRADQLSPPTGLGLARWFEQLELEGDRELPAPTLSQLPIVPILPVLAGAMPTSLTPPKLAEVTATSTRTARLLPSLVKPKRLRSTGPTQSSAVVTGGAKTVPTSRNGDRSQVAQPTKPSTRSQPTNLSTPSQPAVVQPPQPTQPAQPTAVQPPVQPPKQTSTNRLARAFDTGRRMVDRLGRELEINHGSTQLPQQLVQLAATEASRELTEPPPRVVEIASNQRARLPLIDAVLPTLRTEARTASTTTTELPIPPVTPIVKPTLPRPLARVDATQLDTVTGREEQQVQLAVQKVTTAPEDQRELLAQHEAAKVKQAEQRARGKLTAEKAKTDRREGKRRANTSKKANTARTQANRHSQQRSNQVKKRQVDQVALLKEQFAKLKLAQEKRLAELLTSSKVTLGLQFQASKEKQLTALSDGRTLITDAHTRERKSLADRITNEKATEDQNYKTGCADRAKLATQVKANHTKIKTDAVRDANKICTDGCRDFHTIGERLAGEAIATANREADGLLQQGRQAAQAAANRARAALPADAAKADGDRAANGASRAELATWQHKARDRRAEGVTEAKQIRADYKAKAEQLKSETQDIIKQHEASEQREHAAEDKQCATDLETLEKIRVAAHQHFDSVLTDFDAQCQIEVAAYDDYVQTQTAVITREVETQHKAAVQELETDHAQNIEGVKTEVNGKLAEFETKLGTATTRELTGLYKELGTLQQGIDDQVGTILRTSFQRSQAYSQAADQKVMAITTRAMDAVAAIENLGRLRATAKLDGYKAQSQSDRDRVFEVANKRASNSYIRQRATAYNDNAKTLRTTVADPSTIDQQVQTNNQNIAEVDNIESTIRPRFSINPYLEYDDSLRQERQTQLDKEGKQNYLTRRELKTGQAVVTEDTAVEKRTEVLTAISPTDIQALNGKADPGKALALLGSLTREELLIMYPEGSKAREELLARAYNVGISDELKSMLAGNSNDQRNGKDPRAIALDWALRNGDARVANTVLDSLTTDEERAKFDQSYQKLRDPANPPVRDAFANLPEQQRKEVAVTWDAGRTFWNNEYVRNGNTDLTDQWNQDKSRKEAIATVNTYETADKNKLLTLRSEMYKRHAGPYLDGADEQRHKAALQQELEQFDSTVFNVSGKSMESLDTVNTTGKVREALLATSKRTVIDPNEPDFTRPDADWNKFAVALMQRSVERDDYDTRLAEKFFKDLPADRRRELLATYQQQNQTSYVDDINANVRPSHTVPTDTGEVSWNTGGTTPQKVPSSEIDADSLISLANTGEVPDPLRLMQLKNGRGRGDEEDQKEFASTLNKVSSNGEKFQLTADQYLELAKKYNLPTTGAGRDDLIRDANQLLQPRQARKAQFEIETSGEPRTAEWDKRRRDAVWVGDTRPEANSLREAMEGPAGREVYREKERLDEQLQQLRTDGTSNLTREQLQQLMTTGDPAPFDQAQLERFTRYSERSESMTAAYETMRTGYEDNVRYAAMFVATGVVVVGTIVLTGPLGPVMAGVISSAAGGLTTLGIKKIAFDKDYSSKEMRNDVNAVIVDAVVSGVVGGGAVNMFAKKLLGRVSQQWARELLAEVISNGITVGGTELTKALLDPDTYVGNPDQIRDRLLKRVGNAALGGALQGGTKSALTQKAQTTLGVDALGKGVSTSIEVTSNVVGQIPTAKSLSDVFNAALSGLSAYNNGANPKRGDTGDGIVRRDDGTLEVTSPDLAQRVTREATQIRSDERGVTYEVPTETGVVQVVVANETVAKVDAISPQQLGDGTTPKLIGDGNTPKLIGDGNTPKQLGDGTNPKQIGDGNTPKLIGDGTTPKQLGDGTTPKQLGDGNTPKQLGDGTTPKQLGDGTNPKQIGDGMQPTDGDQRQPIQIARRWDGRGLDTGQLDLIVTRLGRAVDWPANKIALERLRLILSGKLRGTEFDRRFFEHEKLEGELMAQGIDYQTAHRMTIRQLGYGDHPFGLYDVSTGILDSNPNGFLWKPLGDDAGTEYDGPEGIGTGIGDQFTPRDVDGDGRGGAIEPSDRTSTKTELTELPTRPVPGDAKRWTTSEDGREIYRLGDDTFVDQDGRRTDNEGTWIDRDGYLTDRYGRRVNAAGQLVNDRFEAVDDSGTRINRDGSPYVEPTKLPMRQAIEEAFRTTYGDRVTVYRALRLQPGQAVDGMYPGYHGGGQLVVLTREAAMTYADKPPGEVPGGLENATEIVIVSFEMTANEVAANIYGANLEHMFVRPDIDITKLAGYREERFPVKP